MTIQTLPSFSSTDQKFLSNLTIFQRHKRSQQRASLRLETLRLIFVILHITSKLGLNVFLRGESYSSSQSCLSPILSVLKLSVWFIICTLQEMLVLPIISAQI